MAKKYDPVDLVPAKELYMKYTPIHKISETTGITKTALYYHISKWREERELLKKEVLDALTESKRELMSTIAKSGLEVLARAMVDLRDSKIAISPKEMVGISNIIDSLDKITKLDDGRPTEITAEIKPATIIEIKKLMAKDPFLEIEDATLSENQDA